jgi:site-specific DNA-methyltransferase (cytosine-N4-specific)
MSLPSPLYITQLGEAHVGDALELLKCLPEGSIDLVLTSPPFALQRQKEYGNRDESEYADWLLTFTPEVKRVLKDSGSFVLDLGGAYLKGALSVHYITIVFLSVYVTNRVGGWRKNSFG